MTSIATLRKLSAEQKFMCSALLVNAGNYLYNLVLGRILGPDKFGDAAVLITLLLVLSFVAMTFQLTTAKFAVLFEGKLRSDFIQSMQQYAGIIGVVTAVLVVVFSSKLQVLFHAQTPMMFVFFGIGVPIYFSMSVRRGVFQGSTKFDQLALTYQREMISRLSITLAFLFLIDLSSSLVIAMGITASFVVGIGRFSLKKPTFFRKQILEKNALSQVKKFFVLTALYELTQILINNSDILMVKHYFETYEAGLYASLALIGRVVYFVTWMLVMLLLPKVVQWHKEGIDTKGLLAQYTSYIVLLSIAIVGACLLFPEGIIGMMFGSGYTSISPLLWKYALATALFAISNLFAYYFLSLDQYIPVLLSGLLGVVQMVGIAFFHDSLAQVVDVQIAAMALLLLVQLLYLYWTDKKRGQGFLK